MTTRVVLTKEAFFQNKERMLMSNIQSMMYNILWVHELVSWSTGKKRTERIKYSSVKLLREKKGSCIK